jgi:hypothetical protein
VHSPGGDRKLNVEILDLPSLTPQAVLVTLYEALLETNESTAETSYHLTGSIDLDGYPALAARPVGFGQRSGAGAACSLPFQAGRERFTRIYSNGARQGAVRGIDLHVEAIPRRVQVELETARLVSATLSTPATP